MAFEVVRRYVCLLDSSESAASHDEHAAVESEDGSRLVLETSETRGHSRPSQSIGKSEGGDEKGPREGRMSRDNIRQKAGRHPEKAQLEITQVNMVFGREYKKRNQQ